LNSNSCVSVAFGHSVLKETSDAGVHPLYPTNPLPANFMHPPGVGEDRHSLYAIMKIEGKPPTDTWSAASGGGLRPRLWAFQLAYWLPTTSAEDSP